jgi:signal transduction histidine kinase
VLRGMAVENEFVEKKLENIAHAVRTVLNLGIGLKDIIKRSETTQEGLVVIAPAKLFERMQASLTLPANIQLKIELEEAIGSVCVFEKLVDDILLNLANNAIDAMNTGGVLTLAAHNFGHQVALVVRDTGHGIPTHKIEKIFNLFYSTKGSSGFGLWSARRNAIRNNGDLKVESQPGQGSIFTLLLPGAPDEENIPFNNN